MIITRKDPEFMKGYRGNFMRGSKIMVDLLLLTAALGIAYLLRFEGSLPETYRDAFWFVLPVSVAIKYAVLWAFSVPRIAWRALSVSETIRIVAALAVGTGILVVIRLIVGVTPSLQTYLLVPFGVLAIDLLLSVVAFLGIRGVWRLQMDHSARARLRPADLPSRRTLLLGTDHRMIRMARDLAARPIAGIDLIGILVEDKGKMGMLMGGVSTLGQIDDLEAVAQNHRIDQLLIPTHPDGSVVRKLIQRCDKCGLKARILDVEGHDGEKVDLARLRAITVDDLLRRPSVRLEGEAVESMLRDRTVLLTGAGGSIGSQLGREICVHRPKTLILVEQAENSLFHIHRHLVKEFPEQKLIPAIADICDRARMDQLFELHRPDVVVHAAAHKHVPMMEWNVREAIKNNVEGTKLLADLSGKYEVKRFVMVSTDKAVHPTSVMGASKRVAELYVQALSQECQTCFVTVRFGNVLGSAGSVIPLFQEQIAQGGPVTVTHPEMKRYFMTIPEACQLILEAGSLGQGGEIFVLDMGEPIKIVDLAKDMIRLAGLQPEVDIEIRYSGIRPGEKLFEELSLEEENAERTRHPRIYIGRKPPRNIEELRRHIADLSRLADAGDSDRMRMKFKVIVPDYDYTPPPGLSLDTDGRHPSVDPMAQTAGSLDTKKDIELDASGVTASLTTRPDFRERPSEQ